MITLNHDNNEEKQQESSIFFQSAFLLYMLLEPNCKWHLVETCTFWGRMERGAGRGGDGERIASLFVHEIEMESKGSQKGSRSVIGHIDLTFIVHLSRGN